MRILLVMRGAPGAGKSTWIKNHNLEEYVLSADDLRTKFSSLELQPSGDFKIARNPSTEKVVWQTLFKILDHKMSRGDFTIVDVTCSKTADVQKYKQYADRHRYRMFLVDFTKVPLATCLRQNRMRSEIKWVPDQAIKNIYDRYETQQIPSGVNIINPDEFDSLLITPFDASKYKRLVFIGDIHGCFDTLMQYEDFKNGLRDDTDYIFLGDYIDRGNQNAEVMHWLYSIMEKPNVSLLEGNHEKYLRDYGDSNAVASKEFSLNTKNQLVEGKFTEKMARIFYRKLKQFSYIKFNQSELFACHGGIPHLNINPLFIPTINFIAGVGEYADYKQIAETWMTKTSDNQYLIHGHRNVDCDETQIADKVFNLEGKIEFGGNLRIVEVGPAQYFPYFPGCMHEHKTLDWKVIELADCQPLTDNLNTEERSIETLQDGIRYLKNNTLVKEKQLGDGISSFNFTRNAFYKGAWNNQTILARGLFIDTVNIKIMARSYEKFFRINEVKETELESLQDNLKFPVTAYVKENGFLGIVSYNYNKDELFIASKSTNTGDFAGYFRDQLKPYYSKVLEYLKNNYHKGIHQSLVFECVDIEHDPHIIKYDKSSIILLDVINNTLEFKPAPYEMTKQAAEFMGCQVKEKAFVLNSWREFKELYNKVQDDTYQYNGKYIEGFIFTDTTNFMTKCKTEYYNTWKKLRSIADQVLRCGDVINKVRIVTDTENQFYNFLKKLYVRDKDSETKIYPYATDIISLRDKYYEKKQ